MKRLLDFFPQGTAGYGIPANSALRVAPDGKITSIGSAPVRFIKKGADIIIDINRMRKNSFLQVAQKGSDTRRPKPGTARRVGLSVVLYAKKSRGMSRT
jgi:hypothetical protein